MNRSLRLRALAISIALALTPSLSRRPAAAQPADSNEAEQAYKAHMQNGVKLYQEKNWQGAIAEFEAAYKARPKASPLVNLALSYKGMFNYPRAIGVLEDALGKHADSLTPGDKKAAEDAIAEMKALLGFVKVELSPPGATVTVDGTDLTKEAAQKPIPLGPGTHRIAARAEGYAPREETITVSSGDKDKKLSFELAPDQGYVTIRAVDAKTAIAVDQKGVGYGTWAGFLTPGTHLVQMYKPGAPSSYSVQVQVTAGKSQEVREGLGGSVTSGPPLGPRQDDDEDDDDHKKKEPPQPPVRGFYGLVTGTVYGVSSDPDALYDVTNRAGLAVGLRLGYRIITILGVEAMFQYGAAGGEAAAGYDASAPRGEYDTTSVRAGLNLRLMTKGKTVRFVGTIGGGVAYDELSFDPTLLAALGNVKPGGNVTGYALLEPGMELEFSHVILGVALPIMPTFGQGGDEQTTSGTDTGNSNFSDTLAQAGIQLRVGYGFW